MSRSGWILLGGAWTGLVFGGVFWLTFPGDAMARRLSWQVGQASHGRYELALTSVKPWWLGLSAENVILSSKDGAAEAEPVLFADAAALRVGLFGLLRRQPTFSAWLRLGDGDLDVAAKTALADRKLKSLSVSGEGVPADELLALLPGASAGMSVSGRVDVDVDLTMPEGLGKADGSVSIVGHELTLDKVTSERLGWTDKELGARIDELDLALAFDGGKGKVDHGVLASSLAEVEIEGDVDLDDEWGRSRIDLQLVADVKDWAGTPLESFRPIVDSALRGATWADNKVHYDLDTTLARFSFSDLKPTRERGGRGSGGAASSAGTTPAVAPAPTGGVAAPGTNPWDSVRTEDLPPNLREARDRLAKARSAQAEDEPVVEEEPPVEEPPEEPPPPAHEDDPPPPDDEPQ